MIHEMKLIPLHCYLCICLKHFRGSKIYASEDAPSWPEIT